MVGRGVDESYCTHLTEGHNPLLLETERESTERKWGETQRQETKRKARQVLDTGEKHACKSQEAVAAASQVRLTDRENIQQCFKPNTQTYNSIFTKRQHMLYTRGIRGGEIVMGYKGSY